MVTRIRALLAVSALLIAAGPAADALACPFCVASSQTFSEEIATMDVAVLAKLQGTTRTQSNPNDPQSLVIKGRFQIVEIIKGKSLLNDRRTIETIYFGDAKAGQWFFLKGTDPPNLMWSSPLALSDRAVEYVKKVSKMPLDGWERLVFFQDYLEDKDQMLAADAYDEFARSPYKEVQQLGPKLKHDKVIEWINDSSVPASRRRLYFTMLGVCGGASDLPMLESLMKSDDRFRKAGLDALIACYMTIKGPEAMPLVEELFLKNKSAEYADTYAAIMAIRFHGSQTDVIPRKRLLVGLRYMLKRADLADLVIPDLARWQDWEVMDELVELFKNADQKSSWVRVPVINYLRACPKPEAKKHIEALEKIDPKAVKRARTFFPYGTGPAPGATKKTSSRRRLRHDQLAAAGPPAEDIALAPPGSSDENTVTEISPVVSKTSVPSSLASPGRSNLLVLLAVPPVVIGLLLSVWWIKQRRAMVAGV